MGQQHPPPTAWAVLGRQEKAVGREVTYDGWRNRRGRSRVIYRVRGDPRGRGGGGAGGGGGGGPRGQGRGGALRRVQEGLLGQVGSGPSGQAHQARLTGAVAVPPKRALRWSGW